MLAGVYDLTDDRDFMNDVPDHLSMKGIRPEKLFKSNKERSGLKQYKDSLWDDLTWNDAVYNLTQTVSGINIRSSTTGINYNYRTTNSFNWTHDEIWDYAVDSDSLGGLTFALNEYLMDYDTRNGGIKIKYNKFDKVVPKAVLPWIRERKIPKASSPIFQIKECYCHGKYFSWRRTSRKRKNNRYYSKCPKCMEEYSFEDLPWNTANKAEDIPFKPVSFSDCDSRFLLSAKLLALGRGRPNIDLKIHNVPWLNKHVAELKRKSDEFFENVPWLKNMHGRDYREYMSELYEDEVQEESPKENGIIDKDTREMDRYLNMRPGENGGMWH